MQHAGGYRPRDGALPVEWIVALPSSGSSRTISPPTYPRRRSKLRAQRRADDEDGAANAVSSEQKHVAEPHSIIWHHGSARTSSNDRSKDDHAPESRCRIRAQCSP
jgi:hypothetical protein